MGLRFKKSKKILPGVRLNFNKRGMSVSVGTKGLRKTIAPSGRTTTSVGIPGTGVSYTTTSKQNKSSNTTSCKVSSPKKKTVVLVLCIALGLFGIHRFYVGKTGSGIVYLFTGGLCMFGWIVDIFCICNGTFIDTNGRTLV